MYLVKKQDKLLNGNLIQQEVGKYFSKTLKVVLKSPADWWTKLNTINLCRNNNHILATCVILHDFEGNYFRDLATFLDS